MVKHHMGMTKSGSLMSGNACLVRPTSASQVLGYSLFRDGLLDLETTSDQTLALERMNLV